MKDLVEDDGTEETKLWWRECRRLLGVADNGARSLEDPELRKEGREFKSASALVERALMRSDPMHDARFQHLSPELKSELRTAYRKFSRDLVRLLKERHVADSDFSEEAKAFLLCLSKKGADDGRSGVLPESCCDLLPAFANCRKRLRKLSELAARVREERPGKQGINVSGKVMLFGASLLAAALLLGGASYFGFPIEKLKEAPSAAYEAGRDALSGLWDKKPESSFSPSDVIRDYANTAKDNLSGAANAARGHLSGAAKAARGHLSGVVASAHEQGGDLLNTFWDKLSSLVPPIVIATESTAGPQG